MKVYERLLEKALSRGRGRLVEDARIGLGYTAVKLSDGRLGLAYTVLEEKKTCNLLEPEVYFANRPADLVARGFLSSNLLEAGVGLATINAILNQPREDFLREDPLELISLEPEDRVAMIGYFEPLARKLRGRVAELWVFERTEGRLAEALSETEMFTHLPEATVAIVTAVTLINKTFEEIISLLEGAREIILLGPSTPLEPEVFEGYPVSLLSGVLVKDEGILQPVSEAKGMRAFGPFIEKVSLRLK
ncbi:MAG: DUF364 domain-containing protein [Thermodesulfobacteria bacterium]|nr:DUF364 domain-containing protein [Thermodesulfobacteriota bacterium]